MSTRDSTLPAAAQEVITENYDESFGEPVYNGVGQVICARNKGNEKLCMKEAGYGTQHLGTGPCKFHGGVLKNQTDAMQIIDRVGKNGQVNQSYSVIIQHERLKELMEYEDARESIDNLDDEIRLTRAMIRLYLEGFGFAAKTNKEGELIVKEKHVSQLGSQAGEIIILVKALKDIIKGKYEILQIAQATIPREVVRAYILRIELILNKTLRDTCPHCKKSHDMRTTVLDAIKLIGNL
tara:strand:+ start:1968 stop:2681 length:714 start_codon:yes stop_codon:yes gene_type:complete